MTPPSRRRGARRLGARRLAGWLVVGLVLALVQIATLAPGRVVEPAWATPWSATTSNGSTVVASAWTSYSSTLLADPSPAYYWRMSDANSTMAQTTGGVNGTYSNAPSYSQTGAVGTSDKAVAFNGSNEYATVNNQAGFSFTGNAAFSVEMWFKRTGTLAASGNPRLINKINYSGSYQGWEMAYNAANDANAGQVYCSRWANGTGSYTGSGVALTVNTWYHLVCTYDGSSLRFYLNGAVVGSPSSSTGSMGTNNQNLYIATMNGSQEYGQGVYDEISIYNVALSARQVRAHYYASFTGL